MIAIKYPTPVNDDVIFIPLLLIDNFCPDISKTYILFIEDYYINSSLYLKLDFNISNKYPRYFFFTFISSLVDDVANGKLKIRESYSSLNFNIKIYEETAYTTNPSNIFLYEKIKINKI